MVTQKTAKTLGIIALVYGVFGLIIFGVSVGIIAYFIASMGSSASLGSFSGIMSPIIAIYLSLMVVSAVSLIMWVVAGIGLIKNLKWARMATIISAIISLFSIPTGTIMGIIYIVFFFKPIETE